MRHILLLVMLTIIASCGQKSSQTNTVLFMGLADDKEVKIGDEAPESALADITEITMVQMSPYKEYLNYKAEGRIIKEERRGRWLYWAVNLLKHVPFSNGSDAYFIVTERHKSEIP